MSNPGPLREILVTLAASVTTRILEGKRDLERRTEAANMIRVVITIEVTKTGGKSQDMTIAGKSRGMMIEAVGMRIGGIRPFEGL